MCGIAGVILKKPCAGDVLTDMLISLEYRGYDSCGIAVITEQGLVIRKAAGKIAEVSRRLGFRELKGRIGIAHTRWATHGGVTDYNAHPHADCSSTIAVVHNGIIENFAELRSELEKLGHTFKSETDTEVVPHLVEHYIREGNDVYEAWKMAVSQLKGSYALAMITTHAPDRIFFARYRSPLLLGIGEGEYYVASDIPALLDYTRKVVVLSDGEIGYVTAAGEIHIENLATGEVIAPKVMTVSWSKDAAKKGGYPHYMLKEIHEQPDAVRNTLIMARQQAREFVDELEKAHTIYLVAAGTSYHACLCAEYAFAKYGLRTEAIIASEFQELAGDAVERGDVVIAVSQSGETADTLEAVRYAKKRGARVLAITNVIGSSLMREAHKTIVMGAGPEIGVAATKTFLCQVAVLSALTIEWARRRGYDVEELEKRLMRSPSDIERVIKTTEKRTKRLANFFKNQTNAYYIGRGIGVPIAMEGALKMKEITYIHAEAYPAGESKHGPIALIEPGYPVVAVVLRDRTHDLVISNVIELASRGAVVLALAERGDEDAEREADFVLWVPEGYSNILAPLVYEPPLQLLAYYTAILRGCDPDKPRNLAKSVTVI